LAFIQEHLPLEAIEDLEVKDFLALWMSLRKDQELPSWKDIGFDRVPTDLLPNMMLVDVEDGGATFRFRFFGTGIARTVGRDLSNKHVDGVQPDYVRGEVEAVYREMCRMKKPVYNLATIGTDDEKPPLKYASLRLPLSSNGVDVDQLLTVVSFLSERYEVEKAFSNMTSDDQIF
jgi:hypothetical protein